MSDVKLIDFSRKELDTILVCVIARELDIAVRIQEREDLFEKAGAEYPSDVPEIKYEHEELERLKLWHTQILNAIGKVGLQEQINSNQSGYNYENF